MYLNRWPECVGIRINRIYDQHASSWTPPLAFHFNDIASQYSLHWDSEYDDYIEDSLSVSVLYSVGSMPKPWIPVTRNFGYHSIFSLLKKSRASFNPNLAAIFKSSSACRLSPRWA